MLYEEKLIFLKLFPSSKTILNILEDNFLDFSFRRFSLK